MLDPPIAFAHRGASAHARPNTLEAFRLGLRLGATGLESDVWLTADGIPVLDHDGRVRHGVRRRPIATMARADLPPHIPSLDELYAECGADYELSLDLKDQAAANATFAVFSNSAENSKTIGMPGAFLIDLFLFIPNIYLFLGLTIKVKVKLLQDLF